MSERPPLRNPMLQFRLAGSNSYRRLLTTTSNPAARSFYTAQRVLGVVPPAQQHTWFTAACRSRRQRNVLAETAPSGERGTVPTPVRWRSSLRFRNSPVVPSDFSY